MPEISTLYVRKYIAQADPSLDPARLYAIAGVSSQEVEDPRNMVPVDACCRLIETLAEAERPAIRVHLRTGASMRCEDFGVVGLAVKSAPTLRQSFERMDRYSRVFNRNSDFLCHDDGEAVYLTHDRNDPDRLGLRLSNEAAFATIVTLCRESRNAPFQPERIEFCHPPLGAPEPLEEFFGCPVTFGAEANRMRVSRAQLDRPNRAGDAGIWSYFMDRVEELLPAPQKTTLEHRIVALVGDLLSDGVPTLDCVASALGMGSRTLQRRLSERGVTFQALVDRARRELAGHLVARTPHAFAEIAFLTGFAEQSSFTRAFRRWFATTQRAYRTRPPAPARARAPEAALRDRPRSVLSPAGAPRS